MARTTQQIEDEIMQAKNNEASLAQLNSISQTAIWRLWVRLTAFVMHVFEQLFDAFRFEIDERIEKNRVGTLSWYVDKVKAFQNGDPLNSAGEYDTINPDKQIITRASVRDAGGLLNVKIAKGDDPPAPLNATELTNFITYLNKVKFAGVAVNVISLPANAVLVDIEILYSQVAEEDAKNSVKQAIGDYIKSIAFDGEFVINNLIAFCRTKAGIVDVLVNNITVDSVAITGGRYTAPSGYYSFDAENVSNNYIMTQV